MKLLNRRSFIKNIFSGFLAFVGITGGSYFYAREIEPRMLQITKLDILSSSIPPKFNNFKIVQLTDTHVGFHYSLSQLKELVTKINKLKPDLIVFTGDLIDEPQTFKSGQELSNILNDLKAREGKFWIYGNHDHGGYGTDMVRNIMDHSGFKLLKNSHTIITQGNEEIVLAGIDDVILGNPNLAATLQNANEDLFTILLAHEPDYADITVNYPVNIQLSGHSHGGQVRFPLIGHLYTPVFAEKYVQGKYTFDNDNLLLYVNRGIGTTRLPFRFLCKPEVLSMTLNNKP